jgi:hypothetical protein
VADSRLLILAAPKLERLRHKVLFLNLVICLDSYMQRSDYPVPPYYPPVDIAFTDKNRDYTWSLITFHPQLNLVHHHHHHQKV